MYFSHISTWSALYFFLHFRHTWDHFTSVWNITSKFSLVKICLDGSLTFIWLKPFFFPPHQCYWTASWVVIILFYTWRRLFLYNLFYFISVKTSTVSQTVASLTVIFLSLFASDLLRFLSWPFILFYFFLKFQYYILICIFLSNYRLEEPLSQIQSRFLTCEFMSYCKWWLFWDRSITGLVGRKS